MEPRPATDIGRLLDRQPWGLLEPHILGAGASPEIVMPRLRRFAELLLEWNRGRSNLISANDETRVVQRHILESIEPAQWINSVGVGRLLDFGSGGGFPALPLIIAGVGASWTLVESRRNKTLFLRNAIKELGLTGIDVRLARLELLGEGDLSTAFDGFTSRATIRIVPTLSLASRFVEAGGSAFLWKGSGKDLELAQADEWRTSWEQAGQAEVGSGPTLVSRFIRKAD